MKKQLLISAFCVCAALSAMAGEQGVAPADELNREQIGQSKGKICTSAEEMNGSNDEMSGFQTSNSTSSFSRTGDWTCRDSLGLRALENVYIISLLQEPLNYVGKPIRPPKSDGTGVSSTLSDLVNNLLNGSGGGHTSYAKAYHFAFIDIILETSSGGYVKRPIKPGSGSGGGTLSLEDLLKPITYRGKSPLPQLSTGHDSKPAGDINSDGVLNLDDVTTMVDNLLSNQNHGAGNGIGDVTGMIDQLLGE